MSPDKYDKYVPGQCNIGRYEAEKRLRSGIFGMLLLFAFSFLFYVFGVPKLIIFVVLLASGFSGVLGLLQYRKHFCVYFGLFSVFNFDNLRILTKVKDFSDIEKDKSAALKLIIYSICLSITYALLYIFLLFKS